MGILAQLKMTYLAISFCSTTRSNMSGRAGRRKEETKRRSQREEIESCSQLEKTKQRIKYICKYQAGVSLRVMGTGQRCGKALLHLVLSTGIFDSEEDRPLPQRTHRCQLSISTNSHVLEQLANTALVQFRGTCKSKLGEGRSITSLQSDQDILKRRGEVETFRLANKQRLA